MCHSHRHFCTSSVQAAVVARHVGPKIAYVSVTTLQECGFEIAINPIEPICYKKTIEKPELDLYKQNYQVISEKLYLGKPTIHILSDTDPGDGFTGVDSSLEDVYFSQIFNYSNPKSN